MHSTTKFARSLIALCAAAVSAATPAHSHAVVILPLSHAAKAVVSLKGLVHHQPVLLPGTGSATVRINSEIIKSIVTRGYANGQSFSINNALGGAVTNGNLTGAIYFKSGSMFTNYDGTTKFGLAIGNNNPLGTGTPFNSISSFPANSLTFANVGTSAIHGGKGLGTPFSAGVSGASRARTALYKSLAGSSTAAGEKSITTLGPVTGGEFFGALGYRYTASSFENYQQTAFTFGNNPLNTVIVSSLPLSQFRNYLTFANGATRSITGGQLTGSIYYIFTRPPFPRAGNPYILSFGNSPFNVTNLTFPASSVNNAIYLAALLGKK